MTSSTVVITHPAGLEHRVTPGHPERPERLRAVLAALAAVDGLERLEAPRVEEAAILRCHPPQYLERIRGAVPAQGLRMLDLDTVVSPGSLEAALRAAGGGVRAVDEVMSGRAETAFVAMRPPGHHAERTRAMGFCLFNTAAIAVRQAQACHGAERVAVVDFDVHHGNGTQDIFWSDPSVLYCSTHEAPPFYPGSGAAAERGEHDTVVNVPLAPGSGGTQFRAAVRETILPRLRSFRPDLIVMSAGFDAHRSDPLADLELAAEDYGWITEQARENGCGRVVSVLEGGYHLPALSDSVRAHVQALRD